MNKANPVDPFVVLKGEHELLFGVLDSLECCIATVDRGAELPDAARLLVFDEAFSKMDHQRIQESIRLLDEVGLQVIIAAPTDNIADIAPLVERNLCVTRVRRETQVKAFDPRDLE